MRLNTYGTDPTGYERLLAWNEHLAAGPLHAGLRAIVEARASQINGCAFCLAMHLDEARAAGVDQVKLDTLAAWRDVTAFDPSERAALALTEAMTRVADGGRVDDGERGIAERYRVGLTARVRLGKGGGLTPAAGPAIENVRSDNGILRQRRGPVGHDIIGVIMGGVSHRRIDGARKRGLGNPIGALPASGVRLAVEPVVSLPPKNSMNLLI